MPGVKRERDASVLDEPATLNAMTPDLLGDLAKAIGEMTDDPDVRALVLTGAGCGFCSGLLMPAYHGSIDHLHRRTSEINR